MTVRYWHSPGGAMFLNQQTGDGRIFPEVRWDETASDHGPLRVAWEALPGHDGAREIGRTTGLAVSDDRLHPEGWINLEIPDGAEVVARADADPPHPLTVSVDLDDVAIEVFGPAMEEDGEDAEPLLAVSFPAATVCYGPDGPRTRVPGARAALTAAGFTGLVAAAGDGVPEDSELWFTEAPDEILLSISGRYRGLTLVDITAFDKAAIALRPADWTPELAVTASVVGATDLPIAERDTEWDGSAAKTRVFDLCTSDAGTVDEACVARAFLWRDDDADPTTQAAYSLGFADVINDRLQIVPAGVFATAGGRGVDALEGVSGEDRDRIKARICTLYSRLAEHFEDDGIVCPFADNGDAGTDAETAAAGKITVQAGAVRIDVPEDADPEEVGRRAAAGFIETLKARKAGGCGCGGSCGGCGSHDSAPEAVKVPATVAASGAVPVKPPKAWFDNPKFVSDDVVQLEDPQTGRTLAGVPMHYGDDGRVWGHLALWGQCHLGSQQGACVLAPRSTTGYQWFHHGQVETAEGDLLPVGSLTLGGGHADIKLSYRGALEHYDNVTSLAAQVRAGEDDYGIWVAGALLPDVAGDDLKMRKLRGSSPSGDWRWIGGGHELAIAHCVNSPGFPVPRAKVAAGGEILALVAAGAREVSLLADAADLRSDHVLTDPEAFTQLVADAVASGVDQYVARQHLATQAERARQSLRDRSRERAAARLRA